MKHIQGRFRNVLNKYLGFGDTLKCRACGEILFLNRSGAFVGYCPGCGLKTRVFYNSLTETLVMSDSIQWETVKNYIEKNKALKWIIIIINFIVVPLLGFMLSGSIIASISVGILFSALTYSFGSRAIRKIQEKERGS